MPRSLALAFLIAASAHGYAAAADRFADLNQTAWRVVDMDDASAEERPNALIHISAGEVHFTAACFAAHYRFTEESSDLTFVAADKTGACDNGEPLIATNFDRDIRKVVRYRLSGDELTLSDRHTLTSIALARSGSADIQNHKLRVIGFFDGRTLVTPKSGLDATATFLNGRLNGSLGCGFFMGSYVLSGNRMRLSAGEMTRGRCIFYGPHDSVITRALTGDHIVQRDGDRIVLRDVQGAIQVVLGP